jgi:hypothetical protein
MPHPTAPATPISAIHRVIRMPQKSGGMALAQNFSSFAQEHFTAVRSTGVNQHLCPMKHLLHSVVFLLGFAGATTVSAQLDSLNIPADCPCTEEIAPVCAELPDGTIIPLPNACIATCLGLPLAADQTCTTWVDWTFPGDTTGGPDLPGDLDDADDADDDGDDADDDGDDADDDAEGDDDDAEGDDAEGDDDDADGDDDAEGDDDDADGDDDDADDDDAEGDDDDADGDDDLDEDDDTDADSTGGAPITWGGNNFQLDGEWEGKEDGSVSDLVGDWNRALAAGEIQVVMWPNPASHTVSVEVAAGIAGIHVMSATGATVLSQQCTETTRVVLPSATWKAGTYVVRILTGDGEVAQRLLQVMH